MRFTSIIPTRLRSARLPRLELPALLSGAPPFLSLSFDRASPRVSSTQWVYDVDVGIADGSFTATFFWDWNGFPDGPQTRISLTFNGFDDQSLEFFVVFVTPEQIEMVSDRRAFGAGCKVRCSDGKEGNPCVICEKDGRTVRFCC